MDGWRTKKPSPSMVVALIALFVAMTGVATAGKGGAVKLKKNSVKSSHIAPGAVGPSDLATGAVTERGLASDSVPLEAIQDDAVDETKIAPSSVGGEEMAPESIDPSKFAGPGAFPYARIDLEDPLPVAEFSPVAVPLEDYGQVQPPGMVNPAQPTRIYAPIAGRYSIKVRVAWNGGTEASSRVISVRRNNSLTAVNHVGSDGVYNVSPGLGIDQELNATFEFQAGDFIQLSAAQSGALPADNPVTLDRARVTMEWVGT